MHKVYLKPGKEESLKRFHPWIFSGAISRFDGEPEEGEVVEYTPPRKNLSPKDTSRSEVSPYVCFLSGKNRSTMISGNANWKLHTTCVVPLESLSIRSTTPIVSYTVKGTISPDW